MTSLDHGPLCHPGVPKAHEGRKVLVWDRIENSRCGPGEPCDQLHIGTAAVPLVLAPVCQTPSWLGHDAGLSPALTLHMWRSESTHCITRPKSNRLSS